jgi:NCS2 family nucleobase:cation symporter-2
MFVVMLVTMTETAVDILAIGQIIDKPAGQQTVTNHLRADMLSTPFASIFNGFLVNAIAQNVGLVAIIGLKSLLRSAVMAQFGTMAVARIRTRSKTDFSGNDIVAVSLGIEILPITVSDFYNRFSEWFQIIF